jgi:hypothetical protein
LERRRKGKTKEGWDRKEQINEKKNNHREKTNKKNTSLIWKQEGTTWNN